MVYLMAVLSAESCSRECAKHIRVERAQRQEMLFLWDEQGQVKSGEESNGQQDQEKQWSMCQGTGNWWVRDEGVPGGWNQILKDGAWKFGFGIEDNRGITEDF